MKKIVVLLLAVLMVVLSISACGAPDGGVQANGTDKQAVYSGDSTVRMNINETWYPRYTGSIAFSETNLYIVAVKNAERVKINDDGSVQCITPGQVMFEWYRDGNLVSKATLMILNS